MRATPDPVVSSRYRFVVLPPKMVTPVRPASGPSARNEKPGSAAWVAVTETTSSARAERGQQATSALLPSAKDRGGALLPGGDARLVHRRCVRARAQVPRGPAHCADPDAQPLSAAR